MLYSEELRINPPEWIHLCSEGSVYRPVEDALGLNHMTIWRELKDKAVDIVLTEHSEPFGIKHRFDTYEPLCDSPDYTIMNYSIRTQDYVDHFQSLLQEYYSVQRLPQIEFYWHQAGFLKKMKMLIFLNPYREVEIEGALGSRHLFIREKDKQQVLRLRDSKKQIKHRSYGWIFRYINLKLGETYERFLYSLLFDIFTPSDYFFYMYEKYRNMTILDHDYDWDLGKWTFQLENGDNITLMGDSFWGNGYQLDTTEITINGHQIEEFFVPLNKIPSECIESPESKYGRPMVICLPDYYFAFHDPYSHAMRFPLHLVEHLPIQCYDPPYVILETAVKNTPLGMYFR